jgi:hypothetical protein
LRHRRFDHEGVKGERSIANYLRASGVTWGRATHGLLVRGYSRHISRCLLGGATLETKPKNLADYGVTGDSIGKLDGDPACAPSLEPEFL